MCDRLKADLLHNAVPCRPDRQLLASSSKLHPLSLSAAIVRRHSRWGPPAVQTPLGAPLTHHSQAGFSPPQLRIWRTHTTTRADHGAQATSQAGSGATSSVHPALRIPHPPRFAKGAPLPRTPAPLHGGRGGGVRRRAAAVRTAVRRAPAVV